MTEPTKDEAEFVPMPRAPGVFGLSRSTLYVLAAQEKIRMVKMGARALVDAESVRKFLATLPEKKPRRDLRHELSNNDVTALAIFVVRAAGWAVVPVEPTFNMESEGSVAMVKLGYLPSPGEVAEIYRAMLAAAPGVKP